MVPKPFAAQRFPTIGMLTIRHELREPTMSFTGPEQIDHRFTAPIEKDGTYATFVNVPGSAEVLGTGRAAKVTGTIDGHPFAATLMPSGEGPHWLPLRAALCTLIGKHQAGEQVAVHLEQRLS